MGILKARRSDAIIDQATRKERAMVLNARRQEETERIVRLTTDLSDYMDILVEDAVREVRKVFIRNGKVSDAFVDIPSRYARLAYPHNSRAAGKLILSSVRLKLPHARKVQLLSYGSDWVQVRILFRPSIR